MSYVWMLLALAMGASVALQGGLNTALSNRLGTGVTLMITTLLVTLLCLLLWIAMPGPRVSPKMLIQAPWYEYLGGVFGFLIIFLAVVLFPRLGAGLTLSLAITGQLLFALIIDHFGLLGMEAHPMNLARTAGVALLISGAALLKFF